MKKIKPPSDREKFYRLFKSEPKGKWWTVKEVAANLLGVRATPFYVARLRSLLASFRKSCEERGLYIAVERGAPKGGNSSNGPIVALSRASIRDEHFALCDLNARQNRVISSARTFTRGVAVAQANKAIGPEMSRHYGEISKDSCDFAMTMEQRALPSGQEPKAQPQPLERLVETFAGQLLRDIRTIFNEHGQDFIPSSEIVNRLAAMEGHPWAEWGASCQPITTARLARMLSLFNIRPFERRDGDHAKVSRGYARRAFETTWAEYFGGDGGEAAQIAS